MKLCASLAGCLRAPGPPKAPVPVKATGGQQPMLITTATETPGMYGPSTLNLSKTLILPHFLNDWLNLWYAPGQDLWYASAAVPLGYTAWCVVPYPTPYVCRWKGVVNLPPKGPAEPMDTPSAKVTTSAPSYPTPTSLDATAKILEALKAKEALFKLLDMDLNPNLLSYSTPSLVAVPWESSANDSGADLWELNPIPPTSSSPTSGSLDETHKDPMAITFKQVDEVFKDIWKPSKVDEGDGFTYKSYGGNVDITLVDIAASVNKPATSAWPWWASMNDAEKKAAAEAEMAAAAKTYNPAGMQYSLNKDLFTDAFKGYEPPNAALKGLGSKIAFKFVEGPPPGGAPWKTFEAPVTMPTYQGKVTATKVKPTGPCEQWQWMNGPIVNVPRDVTLWHIFEAIKETGVHAVIAGGAATDWQKAGDIDIFVMPPPADVDNYDCTPVHAAEKLAQAIGKVVWQLIPSNYDANQSKFIATCYPKWASKPVQIIATLQPTVEALLDSFDLSVHMFALKGPDWGSDVVCGSKATVPGSDIKVFGSTEKTMERAAKLQTRYGGSAIISTEAIF